MLPNFFLAGAPKAGTTSLHYYLAQHPEIYMSPIKEPCYFSDEIRPANFADPIEAQRRVVELEDYVAGPMTAPRFGGPVTRWETYCNLFRHAGNARAVGESSVIYLWSATAARNIAAAIPNARIVIVLRDPISRAYSHYLDLVGHGRTTMPFRALAEANMRSDGRRFGLDFPLLELGLYAEQVQRYLDLFPRDRILILEYEDYRDRPAETLAGIYRFLDVNDRFVPGMTRRPRRPGVPEELRRIRPEDAAFLAEYYAAR